jgi:predicted nucleotide-binding protein
VDDAEREAAEQDAASKPVLYASYAREDYAVAKPILDAVRQKDIEVWTQTENLAPGESFESAISEALEGATGFLVFISAASVASKVTKSETRYFLRCHRGRPIIPVVLEKTAAYEPEISALLRERAVELYLGTGTPAAIARLAGRIAEAVARASAVESARIPWRTHDRKAMWDRAMALEQEGDSDGALELFKEGERVSRELDDPDGLVSFLGSEAMILERRGDPDGAMAQLKDQESICRQQGDKAGLGASLGSQARILRDRGDLDGAMVLLKEQEGICREMGDQVRLEVCLRNEALILHNQGDFDGALAVLEEVDVVCGSPAYQEASRALAESVAADIRGSGGDEPEGAPPRSVFVVHGQDGAFLAEVEQFLSSIGVKSIVLRRIGGPAQSLFQKFMQWGRETRFALVLVSADDFGASLMQYEAQGVGERCLQFRARQNVILELGFFYGHLGWENVFVLFKPADRVYPNFERPSDLDGVVFDNVDETGKWRDYLVAKLRDAGFDLSGA